MISRSVLIRTRYRAEAGLLGWSRIGAQAVQARGRVPALAAVSGPAVGLVVVDRSFLILVGLKLTAVDVILVGLDVRVPLLRQIIHYENGCHWTDRYTGAAINALSRVDIQLKHLIKRRPAIVIGAALCRMDTIHRAHVHTGSIFGPDTGFGDDVGHGSPPCVDRISLRKVGITLQKSVCFSR